jgi:hypothetical protein
MSEIKIRENYFSHDVKGRQIAKYIVKDNTFWRQEKKRRIHETHFFEWKDSTIFVSYYVSSHLVMCGERQRCDQWTSIPHINYCNRTAASSRNVSFCS